MGHVGRSRVRSLMGQMGHKMSPVVTCALYTEMTCIKLRRVFRFSLHTYAHAHTAFVYPAFFYAAIRDWVSQFWDNFSGFFLSSDQLVSSAQQNSVEPGKSHSCLMIFDPGLYIGLFAVDE